MPKEFNKDKKNFQEITTFEAKTLEEVYEKASSSLNCSINDLDIEIVQSPTKGFLGFFAKSAIIKVKLKSNKKHHHKKEHKHHSKDVKIETLTTKLEELNASDNQTSEEKTDVVISQVKKEKIFNEFYDSKEQEIHKRPVIKKSNEKLENEIKKEVNQLFSKLCYKIDEIKVEILDESTTQNKEQKTVYIEFSGEDSALLIGKEGYRYKALSYILFNWINGKYNMMLRLEIAQFLANQEEAIYNYLNPVIETIKKDGYYKTKILDGILIHIALTKLRDEFPDKYVAVKTNQKGDKYILVNEYRN
ncbi:MAG: Jag N-terminal domain-containing protein [Campylobacterota bacterium]|nr:Jag N-terminal domain-containing protein [Campylobacterota bacterium]